MALLEVRALADADIRLNFIPTWFVLLLVTVIQSFRPIYTPSASCIHAEQVSIHLILFVRSQNVSISSNQVMITKAARNTPEDYKFKILALPTHICTQPTARVHNVQTLLHVQQEKQNIDFQGTRLPEAVPWQGQKRPYPAGFYSGCR